jgi:glycosyltransferase involved in cell wall biosynthesis
MNGLRVVLLCDGHLSMNPRIVKEAASLQSIGFRVTVLYQTLISERAKEDIEILSTSSWHGYCYLNLLDDAFAFRWKIQQKAASLLLRLFHIATAPVLGYGPYSLRRALYATKADLAIAHSPLSLWALYSHRRIPYKKGCDFQDWFSDDSASTSWPLAKKRFVQKLESWSLRNCCYRLTTSKAMAVGLANAYSCSPPDAVVNSFALQDATTKNTWSADRPLRLHWFSQTIGPDRGIEIIVTALSELCMPIEIHLRGDLPPQYYPWYSKQAGVLAIGQLNIHPRLPPSELADSLQDFDIGLALEYPNTLSRALTSTNKLFQYMEAGLPVIATDTAGQREVIDALPGCGWLIKPGLQGVPEVKNLLSNLYREPQLVSDAAQIASRLPSSSMGWKEQNKIIQAAALRAFSAGTLL